MDITNKDTYFNRIMKAVVVNNQISDDPEHKGRIQIFIPDIQSNYYSDFCSYLNDNNKSQSSQRTRYPWAYSTVANLQVGNIVYVGNIDNDTYNYIIIGIDVYDEANAGYGGDTSYAGILNGTDILTLAMPIILQNEIGLPTEYYPDSIPDSYYGKINCNDKGAWSIGLIQWHKSRAFTLLYEIAKVDSNWKSYWPASEVSIVQDISNCLIEGSADGYKNKPGYNTTIAQGGPRYIGTQNMLLSNAGKSTQLRLAEADTYGAIYELQNDYNISNPAIIIYTVDIMNQYGSGIPRTKSAAKTFSNSEDDLMTQFEKFVNWCKIEYGYWDTQIDGATGQDQYWGRRKRTYSYIVELYREGKLHMGVDLTSIGASIADSEYIPELGEYLWPLLDCDFITCTYGPKRGTWDYTFNYNTKYNHKGYHDDDRFHYGTDFGCGEGSPCIAVGDGEIASAGWSDSAGYYVSLQADKNTDHYFCYMHLCRTPEVSTGDRVKAGQIVGYSGNTGHSFGAHLHLGLHIGSVWGTKTETGRIDPLPYLGKRIIN